MTKNNYISILLNVFFILIIGLFFLDFFTSFEIKNQLIKSFTFFGFLILSPVVLIWNFLNLKTFRNKFITSILPILSIITILKISPTKIIFHSSTWKTQKILYQNGHLNFNKVEFQMQDIGALGYNKRTVEVIYLTDLFMIVKPVIDDINQRVEWIKVNQEINELGLKQP